MHRFALGKVNARVYTLTGVISGDEDEAAPEGVPQFTPRAEIASGRTMKQPERIRSFPSGGSTRRWTFSQMPTYWPELDIQLVRCTLNIGGFVMAPVLVTVVAGNHGGANPGRDM